VADLSVLVYIFVGSVIMGGHWWKYVVGTVIGVIGIGYIVLEYIPSIEPPTNMRYGASSSEKALPRRTLRETTDSWTFRDADASWGAEQI